MLMLRPKPSFAGLSHLITKSISEDRYGVVQRDLDKVLASFLNLLQVGRVFAKYLN